MSLTCPVCSQPHTLELEIIEWLVCSECQHLLAYRSQTLVDCGETPKTPNVENNIFQIGTTGYLRKRWFKVIGRLHYRYDPDEEDEYWDEWFVYFDDGTVGFIITEDGKIYFYTARQPVTQTLPDFEAIKVGSVFELDDEMATVFEVGRNWLYSFEGQLHDHPLPGTKLNYFDCKIGNSIVGVEYLEDHILLDYGIRITDDELVIDSN